MGWTTRDYIALAAAAFLVAIGAWMLMGGHVG